MTTTTFSPFAQNVTEPHRIRCAHCHGVHETVAEVRHCSTVTMRHPVTEDGVYRHKGSQGDEIYKVQVSQMSGRLYAKRLEDGGFTYAPGAIRHLFADEKMTLEQAKEYGQLYGVCCRCGRVLTDEESIAAGIGPICASKF